jgi:archaellin
MPILSIKAATTNNTVMKRLHIYKLFAFVALFMLGCSEDPVEEDNVVVGRLTGIVVEDGTNVPLENVKVSTNPNTSTVFTDATGNFVIEEIEIGEYSVQAELDGYITDFESAEISSGITTNVVFELRVETANNQPPSIPVLISPTDGATEVPLQTELVWSSSDPEDDDITYNIELRNDENNEVLSFETLNDTTVTVSNLRFGLKYFWQVTAKDDVNEQEVLSPVSAFETIAVPPNRFLFVRKIGENNVIFSSDEQGNELQLTSDSENSWRPRRNIFANKIAFLSNDGGQTHIFTMNPDGSNVQQITSAVPVNGFDLDEVDFTWSANGGRIIYPNFDKLYSINFNGTGLEEIYQTDDGSFISEVVINATESLFVLKTNDVSGYKASIFTIDTNGNVIDEVLSGVEGAAGGLDISIENDLILYWYH